MNLVELNKVCQGEKNLHYLRIYDNLFAGLMPSSILELGVYQGGSLRLWNAYFPNAKVVGIDIKKCDKLPANVRFYQGDQSDVQFLETVACKEGPFDIIIDDASHKRQPTEISLKTLFRHVRRYYVIEDWACDTDCKSIFDSDYKEQHNSLYLLDFTKSLIEELAICHASKRKHGDSKFSKIELYENMLVIHKAEACRLL